MIHAFPPASSWALIAVLAILAYYGARAMGAAAERIDEAIGRAGYDVSPETDEQDPPIREHRGGRVIRDTPQT